MIGGVAAWRIACAALAAVCCLSAYLLDHRSATADKSMTRGVLITAMPLLVGVATLPSATGVGFFLFGLVFLALLVIMKLRDLSPSGVRVLHAQSSGGLSVRLDRGVADGTPPPAPLAPRVLDADSLPRPVWLARARTEGGLRPSRSVSGPSTQIGQLLDVLPIFRAVLCLPLTLRRALRHHQPTPVLLLWVFDGEMNPSLLSCLLAIGPVYHLRGGARLSMLSELVDATLQPDRLVEQTHDEVTKKLSTFRPRRLGTTYMVNSLVCNGDVWQFAVSELLRRTEVVVMDLSRYADRHEGCRYEMGLLVDHVPMGRVTFIVDQPSDVAVVAATLEPIWATMAADSPNRSQGMQPTIIVANGRLDQYHAVAEHVANSAGRTTLDLSGLSPLALFVNPPDAQSS